MRYLALFLAFLVGCVPQYLVPFDYTLSEDIHQAFVEVDSVTFIIENLEVTGDHLIFGLEVINESTDPVHLHIEDIHNFMSFQPFHKEANPDQEVLANGAMSLREINRYYKNRENAAKVAGALLFVLGTALVVNDMVKDSEDSEKSHWEKEDADRAVARDVATFAGLTTVDILSDVAYTGEMNSRDELRFLPDELFLRETIFPGESHKGKVFFRKSELYNFYRLKIPFKNASLYFDFRRATQKEREHLQYR